VVVRMVCDDEDGRADSRRLMRVVERRGGSRVDMVSSKWRVGCGRYRASKLTGGWVSEWSRPGHGEMNWSCTHWATRTVNFGFSLVFV
jgi:hypothetical protein